MKNNFKTALVSLLAVILGVTIVTTPLMLQMPMDSAVKGAINEVPLAAPQIKSITIKATPPSPLPAQAALYSFFPILIFSGAVAFAVLLIFRKYVQEF